MDILKVLSRGTKRTSKAVDHSTANISNIPSANRPNPQLFHDDVGSFSRKRKRGEEAVAASDDGELSDMDFFAPRGHVEVEKTTKAARKASKAETRPVERKAEPLDEDECRQLLRSHRLKLTVLSAAREKQTKVRKSRKKKAPVRAEGKQEKEQLYPRLLVSMSDLRDTYGISPRLAENLAKQQYRVPTEVQMASLPLLLHPELALPNGAHSDTEDGVDFLAVAPTGSGKTLSFLVPAINDIMRRRAREKDGKPHELDAIVVAPTRELARQIANEGKKLAVGTGVRIVAMKKGMRVMAMGGSGAEEAAFESEGESSDDEDPPGQDTEAPPSSPITKADIVVTTPMLLLNYLSSGPPGSKRKSTPTVRLLVLDEADVLLDPLFRDQTLALWAACTHPALRVTFWSATMGSNIESLVVEQVAARAQREGARPRPLVRLVVGLKDAAVPNVAHRLIYTATEQGKLLALRQLLHPVSGASDMVSIRPPFLVFAQTIERASALHGELRYDVPLAAGGSARVAVLHSALSDAARSVIMRRFRAGEIWVLITTDVLARGVDFAGVNGVVNYDVPGSPAAYVHRAGRTGRAGRDGGVAVTLYTKDDIPFVKSVANVIAASERQAGRNVDGGGLQKWLLDALPDVAKADRKKLKERGVESRRSRGGGAKITSKSAWERRRDHNRRGAIEGSKRRKALDAGDGDDNSVSGWSGIAD